MKQKGLMAFLCVAAICGPQSVFAADSEVCLSYTGDEGNQTFLEFESEGDNANGMLTIYYPVDGYSAKEENVLAADAVKYFSVNAEEAGVIKIAYVADTNMEATTLFSIALEELEGADPFEITYEGCFYATEGQSYVVEETGLFGFVPEIGGGNRPPETESSETTEETENTETENTENENPEPAGGETVAQIVEKVVNAIVAAVESFFKAIGDFFKGFFR